jgi:hypothetical protein
MIKNKVLRYVIILLFSGFVSVIAAGEIPVINVKVNYLSDAQAFYITQATWLPDVPDALITIYFNSDNKTFWRYVINEYNPVNDVYTTLFEEQEQRDFYLKLFFYNKGDFVFLKKFNDKIFDDQDYVIFYDRRTQKKTSGLLKNEKSRIHERKNMLGREVKGRLTDCNKNGCLKIKDNKLFFIKETKDKKVREEFLFENVSMPSIISGTNLIVFKKTDKYFIYDIDLKKTLYKLNFIEGYSKIKVDVVNLIDFDPQGKYVLFETNGQYKGRNKKCVGKLETQIFR